MAPSRTFCLWAIGITAIIVVTASVAVLVAGIALRQYPIDYDNLPNFGNSSCTPTAVTTIKLDNCFVTTDAEGSTSAHSEWIAVWKCQETGASIVEDPFSAVNSQTVADNSNNDYPLGVAQDVYCNKVNLPITYPNVVNFNQCQVWNACFFDVSMIIDLQANAQNRYNQGLHLLLASAGLFGLSIILAVICVVTVCCCDKPQFV